MTRNTREELLSLTERIDRICESFEAHVRETEGLIQLVQKTIGDTLSEQREEIIRLREELTRISTEDQERRAKALDALESE